jgi:protein-tyrosine-phosphatase
MDLLFVCTGNTCRSPMAEAIMRRITEERGLALSVHSAGIRAESIIAPQAMRALQRRGIETHQRPAVQLTEEMVDGATLILCMTDEQCRILAEALPANAERIFTWGALVAPYLGPARPAQDRPPTRPSHQGRHYDVPDPVGHDDAVYEATAATIATLAIATLHALDVQNGERLNALPSRDPPGLANERTDV